MDLYLRCESADFPEWRSCETVELIRKLKWDNETAQSFLAAAEQKIYTTWQIGCSVSTLNKQKLAFSECQMT